MIEIQNNFVEISTPPPYRPNMFSPPPYRPPMGVRTPAPYRPPMSSSNSSNTSHRVNSEDDEALNNIVRNLLWNFPENDKTKLDNLVLLNCANESECSICMEHDVSPSTGGSLKCKHTFHTECLKKWFAHGSTTCPCCRASIDVNEYC